MYNRNAQVFVAAAIVVAAVFLSSTKTRGEAIAASDASSEMFVLFASERLVVGRSANSLSGEIGSNGKLTIAAEAQLDGNVFADELRLGRSAIVFGDAAFNTGRFSTGSSVLGEKATPLALPVIALPALPSFSPGTANMRIADGASAVVPPGAYAKITLGEDSRVTFTGGVYEIETLRVRARGAITFAAVTTLNVRSALRIAERAVLVPGASLTSSDVTLNFGGNAARVGNDEDDDSEDDEVRSNGADDADRASSGSHLALRLLAPQAHVVLAERTVLRGRLLAKRITVGRKAIVSLDDAFGVPADPAKIVRTPDGARFPVNRILVDLVPEATLADAGRLAAHVRGSIVGLVPEINLVELEVPANSVRELDTIIGQLRAGAGPNVAAIVREYLTSLASHPTDLGNLGEAKRVAYDTIRLRQAWDLVLARKTRPLTEQTIGVVDTGVAPNHQEFEGVEFGTSPQSALTDPTGHGTSVAGIIGASNSLGSALDPVGPQMNGVVSGVPDLTYKLEIRKKDAFSILKLSQAARAGSGVVNMSFTGPVCSDVPKLDECFSSSADFDHFKSLYNLLFTHYSRPVGKRESVLFVAAAGNWGIDASRTLPAGIDIENVITVAATDGDRRGIWPDVGEESNFGERVDIAAPGTDVYAPTLPAPAAYMMFRETSASAPLVSGVAAILRAMRPDLGALQVKEILRKTAEPIATDKALGSGCSARNNELGCRLDAEGAVSELLAVATVSPSSVVAGTSVTVQFGHLTPRSAASARTCADPPGPGVTSHVQRDGGGELAPQMTLVESSQSELFREERYAIDTRVLEPAKYVVWATDNCNGLKTNEGAFTVVARPSGDAWLTHRHDAQRTGRSSASGPVSAVLLRDPIDLDALRFLPLHGPFCIGTRGEGMVAPTGSYYLTGAQRPEGQPNSRGTDPRRLLRLTPDGTVSFSEPAATSECGLYRPSIGPDGNIYVATTHAGRLSDFTVHSFTSEGSLRWERAYLNPGFFRVWDLLAAPDGTVYEAICGPASFIIAANPDGSLKWLVNTFGCDGRQLALSQDGSTLFLGGGAEARKTADGTLKWRASLPLQGGEVVAPGVGPDGSLFYGTRSGAGTHLFKLDPTTGAISSAVGFAVRLEPCGFVPQGGLKFAIAPDGSVIVSLAGGGRAALARVKDGAILGTPICLGSADTLTTLGELILDAEGRTYVGAKICPAGGACRSELKAYAPDGEELFAFPLDGEVIGEPVLAPNGTLFVATLRTLYTLAFTSGSTLRLTQSR